MKEIFEKNVEIEEKKNNKLDLSLFKRKSSSKTYKGWIIGQFKKAINDKNKDVAEILQTCYKKYIEFDEIKSTAQVRVAKWKGKRGISIISVPEKFIVIRYRKKDQDSLPKEIRRDILKKDVNLFILALNSITEAQEQEKMIKTREIIAEYCKLANLKESTHKKPLFDSDGFVWDNWFADRYYHNFGVDVLGILDYYDVIRYRGGKTNVLKIIIDIQTIL